MTDTNRTTDLVSHTPGPWSVEKPLEFELSIVEADKPTHEWKFIANVPIAPEFEFPQATAEANARLIAAAPDLLAALKAMDESLCNGFDTQAARHAGRMALIAARAAIAKAEGRS